MHEAGVSNGLTFSKVSKKSNKKKKDRISAMTIVVYWDLKYKCNTIFSETYNHVCFSTDMTEHLLAGALILELIHVSLLY